VGCDWAVGSQSRYKNQLEATLVEEMRKARERVLRGMSDAELNAKIKELEEELGSRNPKIKIEFIEAVKA
jgi:hypothetical protein